MKLTILKAQLSLCLALFTLSACTAQFDEDIWKANTDAFDTKNPRYGMAQDLMDNYLSIGMTEAEVLDLLGPPKSNKLENRLPRDLKKPDSLSLRNLPANTTSSQLDSLLARSSRWSNINALEAIYIEYPVGWDLIDAVSLVLQLNNNKEVVNFWLEQH